MDSGIRVTTVVETGQTQQEPCLTCGRRTPISTVEIRYVSNDPTREPGEYVAVLPHCAACRAAFAAGRLPVHPSWFRRPDDAPARRTG